MFNFGPKIDVATIQEELHSGTALLVDVREDDEWDGGHAQGAVHLSLGRIYDGEAPTKDTAKKLYVYCASGGRSSTAEQLLKSQGFEVENIGGLQSWSSAGGLVE